MSQLDPRRYRQLTRGPSYAESDGLYWDTQDSKIVFAVDDVIKATIGSTGLVLETEPTSTSHAATKGYVDGGTQTVYSVGPTVAAARLAGSSSDDAAVATVIASIPSTGGVLYFPPGTYTFTSTLSFPLTKSITMRGEIASALGEGWLSKLSFSGSLTRAVHFAGSGRTANTTGAIEGLAIYGTSGTGPCLEVSDWSRFHARDLLMNGGTKGVYINDSHICVIERVKVNNATTYGFHVVGNENYLDKCQAVACDQWGLYIDGTVNRWRGDLSVNGEQASTPATGGGVKITGTSSMNAVDGYWESVGGSEVMAELDQFTFYNTISLWGGENLSVVDSGVGNIFPRANGVMGR